LYNYLFDIALL